MESSASAVVLMTLIVYKLALLGIGFRVSSRNRNEADFFLAGRSLGPVVAGLSYAASTSSAWVLLGFSGFVYAVGVSAIWMVPGIWAGYAVVWLYFGPRLMRESRACNQVTLTDFLLQDVDDRLAGKRFAASMAALLILLCFIFYIAAQFDAAGTALSVHFQITRSQAIILGATVVLLYSLAGGFWAVSITDALQAITMLVVAISVPLAALVAAGGFASVWVTLQMTMPSSYLAFTGGYAGLIFTGFVIGVLGTSLGTFGQPHLLNRLMAVKGDVERRRGFWISISWGIVVYVGMVILGLSGRALMPALGNGEEVFYQAAGNYLPLILAGIVVAATLSAVMSTVDSILLAASGAVAHDMGLNARFAARQVMVSRLVMSGITMLAVLMTLNLPDTIFNRVLFAWSALGAAFGPIVVWRVFGGTVSIGGALTSMFAGFFTTVLFYGYGAAPPTEHWLSVLAHLPGDPFERVIPWLPCLLILASPLNHRRQII